MQARVLYGDSTNYHINCLTHRRSGPVPDEDSVHPSSPQFCTVVDFVAIQLSIQERYYAD